MRTAIAVATITGDNSTIPNAEATRSQRDTARQPSQLPPSGFPTSSACGKDTRCRDSPSAPSESGGHEHPNGVAAHRLARSGTGSPRWAPLGWQDAGVLLWIVGAGGVGREALDACQASGIAVAGFLDEGRVGEVVRGLPVLTPDGPRELGAYLVAIADPEARQRLSVRLDDLGWIPQTITPRAATAPVTPVVGPGALLLANAYISTSVTIGRHCQVQYNATVGHDSILEDFVTVYPGANVSGSVHLGERSTVGSNAVVLQGRSVGRGAFVGAGAVVTRDVSPGVVVVGSPRVRVHCPA